jgi:hypothetical protein
MALKDTNAGLAELASRCAALEAENKALRVHLAQELKTALSDAQHQIQDSIHIPVDGKDCIPIKGDRGDKGIAGNVLTITAKDKQDIQQYVRRIRKKERERHASHLEDLDRRMRETYGHSHRGLLMGLAELKRELGDLGNTDTEL